MLEALFAAYASTFALVVARIAGFVVGSPFPGSNVSRSQRIGLVMVLAWMTTSFAHGQARPPAFGLDLILAVVVEVFAGLVIGLTFRLVFAAAEIVGQLLGQSTGLGMPGVLNPTIEAEDSVFARIVTLLAMLLALAGGVHRLALGYLLASFQALPVGGPLFIAGTPMVLIDLIIKSFAVGVQLAMPAVAVAFVVQLGLAIIARAAPSLQIFNVGHSVLLVTGLAVILTSLRDLGSGLSLHFSSLPDWLDPVLINLAGQSP